MPRITKVQAAHTYGVLDPHLADRDDTKFVNGSLSDGRNIIMLPQGGYTGAGGTTDFGRVRRTLATEAVTAGMLTLPNGGAAASLIAGNTITTGAAAGSRFVLVEVDFGAAKTIHFADIANVAAATSGGDAALICEFWTGSAWATFGVPLLLTTRRRTRRFASGAPGHAGITAQRFRFCVSATAGAAGAISFNGIGFKHETTSMADAVMWRHSPAKDVNCIFVVTAGNADVFVAGLWQASFPVPVTQAQLREVKPEAKSESILFFHRDFAPQIASMLGDVAEWSIEPLAFENVPDVDYGENYTNGVTAIQQIQFYSIGDGQLYDLMLEGQQTIAIEFKVDPVLNAANVKAALEDLPNVDPGLTVTGTVTPGVGYFVTVEFTGGNNKNREWLTMSGTTLVLNGYVRIRTTLQGKAGGEPIISDARGWPSVGRFVQQRLLMAGLKSRPTDMLATVTGSVIDLNTELGIPTAALSYEVEASNNTEVRDVATASRLIFLGDEQATYLRSTTLSATEAPVYGNSDAPGISPICPIVPSDNALFYVQEGGNTLRMLSYTELEQNYVADNASILSAHLIKGVTTMTRRRAVGSVDSDLIILVNGDGTETVLTMMRTQEVSGFAPWVTDGAFRHAIVDNGNTLWHLVERGTDNNRTLRLERDDPDGLLDEAETRTYEADVSVLTGLQRFDGRAIYVVAGDEVIGPFTVSGGVVDLGRYVLGDIVIGTWIAPRGTDHAYRPEAEAQRRMARQKRVNRVQLSLIDTTNVALEVNGAPAFDLPLVANDDLEFATGELARGYTGSIEAEGMHGFTPHAQVTVTQLRPGRLTLRALTKDIVA